MCRDLDGNRPDGSRAARHGLFGQETHDQRRRVAADRLVEPAIGSGQARIDLDDERPVVSGVYHNRLRIGMLLQCDPTLLYALYLDGRRDRNIRRADFDNPSPYNTYRVGGMPPGPIGNPGSASLQAALAPAETEYLYFVGKNDGSHAFARTLREHNANVNRYQR